MTHTGRKVGYVVWGLMLIVLLILSSTIAMAYHPTKTAYADGAISEKELEELCADYTEDLLLYGENENGNLIMQYENYLEQRFQVKNPVDINLTLTDEWIFRIVPKELFLLKKRDFYILEKNTGSISIMMMPMILFLFI